MSTLPSQANCGLFRRCAAARYAIRHYDVDPALALSLALWPPESLRRVLEGDWRSLRFEGDVPSKRSKVAA